LVATQPNRYRLDEDESHLVTVMKLAKYFGCLPHQVEEMPYEWYCKSQAFIRAEETAKQIEATKRKNLAKLRGRSG